MWRCLPEEGFCLLRHLLGKCSALKVDCQTVGEIQKRGQGQHQLSVPIVVTVESTLHLNYSGCFPLLLKSNLRTYCALPFCTVKLAVDTMMTT